MRLYFRVPAAIVAFILFIMAACALLQAQSEPETPSCHSNSGSAPEPESDLSIKFCCEAGLIPNNKIHTDVNANATIVVVKFNLVRESVQPITFDTSATAFPKGPTIPLPLRI